MSPPPMCFGRGRDKIYLGDTHYCCLVMISERLNTDNSNKNTQCNGGKTKQNGEHPHPNNYLGIGQDESSLQR